MERQAIGDAIRFCGQLVVADRLVRVDLVLVSTQALEELGRSSGQFLGPLQELALASLGMVGNLLFMIVLSLFIALGLSPLIDLQTDKLRLPRWLPVTRAHRQNEAGAEVAASPGASARRRAGRRAGRKS